MESQTLDTLDVTRIETSVNEAVTKIDELVRWLSRQPGHNWDNPLPAIRDQFSVGLAALNRLRAAHQNTLQSVTAEEGTVKLANETERKGLSGKQEELERKEKELRERELALYKREGGLDAKDEQLGNRERNLDAREFELDAQAVDEVRLAEREGNLKTAEAAVSEKHDEQVREDERLKNARDRLNADMATAEQDITRRIGNVLRSEDQVKKDHETASKLSRTHAGRIATAAGDLESSISRSNTAVGGLSNSLGSAQTAATTIETKLSNQSPALDKQSSTLAANADKLATQSTTVDTISKKLSGLDLGAVEKLAELKTDADKLLEEFSKVGSHVYGLSINARGAATDVEKLKSEHLTRLQSTLEELEAKAIEIRDALQMPVRGSEPASGTSGASSPSEKRRHPAAHRKSRKRLSQGLLRSPTPRSSQSSGQETERAQFGAALAQRAKASDDSRPGSQVAESQSQSAAQPSSSSALTQRPKASEGSRPGSQVAEPQTLSEAQPVESSSASATQPVLPSASSSTPQVPRWINEDVASEISAVWARLEFSQPDLWTDADATKFKALLKRFQLKAGSDRPLSRFAICSSQQQNGRETCYECKSASKGNGVFDNGNDNACHTCSTQRKPCFRVTRTAEEGKWLITRRQ